MQIKFMEKNRVIHFQIRKNIKKVNHLGIQNEDLTKRSFTQIIQFDYLRKSFIATFSILIQNHHSNMSLLSVKDKFEKSLSYIKSGRNDMTIFFLLRSNLASAHSDAAFLVTKKKTSQIMKSSVWCAHAQSFTLSRGSGSFLAVHFQIYAEQSKASIYQPQKVSSHFLDSSVP